MSVTQPTNVNDLPSVKTEAKELSSDIATIELTKLRFKLGGSFIMLAILTFFLGHLAFCAKWFTKGFEDHSWTMTLILLAFGGAFSGKEVTEALADTLKAAWGKSAK